MSAYPLRTAALAVAASIGLSGCAYNGLYSGVSVGIGNSGYYDPYYDGYGYGYGAGYPGHGYGYGFDPYWGWYDDYYYPGTGFYVYDRYRRPFRWTDAQRRYWTIRRERAQSTTTTGQPVVIRDHWDGFNRDRAKVRRSLERRGEQPVRVERESRPVRVERVRARSEEPAPVRVQRVRVQSEEPAAVRVKRSPESPTSSSSSSDRGKRPHGRHGATDKRED